MATHWDISKFIAEAETLADAKLDYIRLFVSKFLADDNVIDMSAEECGAYFLLLLRAWQQSPPASIPNDDKQLARWSKLSVAKWMKIKGIVLQPFLQGPDGRFYQKRLAFEWLASARPYVARSRSIERVNDRKKNERSLNADRDSDRNSDSHDGDNGAIKSQAKPSIAQPSKAKITPPKPSPDSEPPTAGVGGSNSVADVGMGSGGLGREMRREIQKIDPSPDDENSLQRQAALCRAGVGGAAQKEFIFRKDIAPAFIDSLAEVIRSDPKVQDVAAVLVSRLRAHNGHAAGKVAG